MTLDQEKQRIAKEYWLKNNDLVCALPDLHDSPELCSCPPEKRRNRYLFEALDTLHAAVVRDSTSREIVAREVIAAVSANVNLLGDETRAKVKETLLNDLRFLSSILSNSPNKDKEE